VKSKVSRPKSQVKIPPDAVKHYSLHLIEWTKSDPMSQTILGEIDISREAFGTLKANSKRAGDYTYRGEPIYTNLLNIGLEAMLNAFPPAELENATNANNALMQLLVENIEFQGRDSGASSFAGGKESESLRYGIFQLVASCRKRLAKAMEVAS